MTEDLREHFDQTLSGAFPTRGFPYRKAAILILYWAEDDFQPPCEKEADEVRKLFSRKFQYDTVVFPIPSDNSRNALEKAVVDFKFANDAENNLMIIYYSGHGDPDKLRGKAVWAAKRAGDPTIDWFELQPYLENAHADVLLIFDCCHASLAAKTRDHSRLELLAASSAKGVTPCPGPHSFTRYLIDELEKALVDSGSLQVDELHTRINRRTVSTTRITPVHFTLRSDPLPSIILRPLLNARSRISPLGAFTFTISVLEPPSKHNIKQLGEWMKRTAPSTVFAVNVDRVVDLSTSLQGFLLDENQAGVRGRFIDNIQPDDKALLLADLREIGRDVADIQVGSSTSTTSSIESTNVRADANIGTAVFKRLEKAVNKLFQSTWSAVSRHSTFQLSSYLTELQNNNVAQQAGISAAANISLLAQDLVTVNASQAAYIPHTDIVHKSLLKEGDQFSLAWRKQEPVVLEIIRYLPNQDGSPPKALQDQFAKTSSMLASPKPDYYRILRCIGYTQETQENWYGLVFETPEGCTLYSTLEAQFSKTPRVPLEIRYRLASSLALSISGLHNVHWVHKGIRSENILFFRRAKEAGIKFDQPWLFGFEYTRENSAHSSQQPDYGLERLVYLPPSRWGVPTKRFSYEHDIYTLGVLLLEVGYWRSALKLSDKGFKRKKPEEVQTVLIDCAGKDLAHIMSSEYSQAVLTCLTGQWGNETNRESNFNTDVVRVLERLAT